jgi:methionyl-tRNA formyltransferase
MDNIYENKIKVIFMGTPEFALAPLASLINADFIEVQAVVTQEDKPVGRKQVIMPPPVKVMALQNGIPVLQPSKINGNIEFEHALNQLEPDFFVVTAYGKILPKNILDIPSHGAINIHGSLLPKYRGASPVEEALLNGDPETGVTFIKMNEKLDAGDVIFTERVKILPEDTSESLRKKLSYLAAAQLPFVLKDILDEVINPLPQNEDFASYCRKINKSDGEINLLASTAKEVLNKIRAYSIWPKCHIIINGKILKILKAEIDADYICKPYESHKLLGKNSIGLCTKKGLLIPQKVQLEGKKETDIQEFLKGNAELFKKLPTRAK